MTPHEAAANAFPFSQNENEWLRKKLNEQIAMQRDAFITGWVCRELQIKKEKEKENEDFLINLLNNK